MNSAIHGIDDQLTSAQKLYQSLAARYDAETRFINGIRREAIAAVKAKPGELIVDAGCGTGWCIPALAEAVASLSTTVS